ncbi:MAG: hypothetical protein SFV15_27290 [Polyangiaceae bacterium]|nr:hypothetical protein [Polyangiaceae bacterium]
MKPICVVAIVASTFIGWTGSARAESSAWLSFTGGPATLADDGDSLGTSGLLEISSGLGTSPLDPLVWGGLVRSSTYFASGTDLSLLGRVATSGYALGNWGVALDAGGYERFWGRGSAGFTGSLSLGAPWGLVASAGGMLGTNSTRGASVSVGFDFARLTIFRTSGENWWKNPYPIAEHAAAASR